MRFVHNYQLQAPNFRPQKKCHHCTHLQIAAQSHASPGSPPDQHCCAPQHPASRPRPERGRPITSTPIQERSSAIPPTRAKQARRSQRLKNPIHHQSNPLPQRPSESPTPIECRPICNYFTMASIVRPSLLRQTAMASRWAAGPSSKLMGVAAFHNTARRAALIPPPPRESD